MFLLEESLQGPLADSPHAVVRHGGDEESKQLVGAGLQRQALSASQVLIRSLSRIKFHKDCLKNLWLFAR